MAKVINAYRGFSASTIESRADVPDAGDTTVNGSTVECVNITTAKVKNALGASTNSVYALATHANVNHWSGFGPTVRSWSNPGTLTSTLVNSDPSEGKLGDFAGYDHSAITPGWSSGAKAAIQADKWILSGNSATFDAYVNLGQVNFPTSGGTAVSLVLTLWNGSTMLDAGFTALSGLQETNCFVTAETGALTSETTVTSKVFIGDSADTFASNGANALCICPNVDNATTTVKIIPASTFTVDPGTFTVTGAGIAYSSGQIDFTSAYDGSNSYGQVSVWARIVRYDSAVDESILMYQGSYTAGNTLYPSTSPAQFATVPIPSYGYTCTLRFNIDF